MTDADHDRQFRRADRAGHGLLVECPEVLEGPAAANEQDHVDFRAFRDRGQHRGDPLARARSLHRYRVHDNRCVRGSTGKAGQHIAQRRRLQRRDHADGAGDSRQLALGIRVKESLGREPGLEAQEFFEQPTLTGSLHRLDAQLEFAPRLVQRHRGRHLHLVAVARHPVQQLVAAAKHHAAHLSLVVLEDEVPVTARRSGEVGDLAAYPQERKAAVQQPCNRAVQRGNRQWIPHRCWLGAPEVNRHAGFRAEPVHTGKRGADIRGRPLCREEIGS